MGTPGMAEYDRFVKSLGSYPDAGWWKRCFSLLQRLFAEMEIPYDSRRIAMNVNSNHSMPVNIGQRYIFQPLHDGSIQLLLPNSFDPATAGEGWLSGYQFKRSGVYDARLVTIPFRNGQVIDGQSMSGQDLPEHIYLLWKTECLREWHRTNHSGYRRYHQTIYYDAVVDNEVRDTLLSEAFGLTNSVLKITK